MPYNPYGTNFIPPYQMPPVYPAASQQPAPQQTPQLNPYAFVNGIEGAKSFPMQPNQTMLLMDSDNPIVYMKQANSLGQATIRYFRLTEIKESDVKEKTPSADYATKEEFDALQKKVNELLEKDAKPVQ